MGVYFSSASPDPASSSTPALVDPATWQEELLRHSPSLVDRVALNTATLTIDEMSSQLAEVIHPSGDS